MALDKLTKLTSQSGITTTIDYQMSDLTVDTITVQSGGIKMPVGMSTFQNVTVTGDLTVNGTTTTLDTDLIGVDKLEVSGNNTTVVGIITQAGSGDILRLYDSTTEVFKVADGGTSTFTVGTNKSVQIYAATHNDETNLGAGIGFSRQSDGVTPLSGIFGHSNTGLGVAARDHITFLTGGSSLVNDTEERLRITSAGKVGIGTVTPGDLVHINTTGNVGGLRFGNAQNLNAGTIRSNWNSIDLIADQNLTFQTNSNTRMKITNGGLVGIGTVTPGYKLDISDDGVAFPNAAGSTLLRVRDGGGTATISIDSAANASGAIQFGDTAAASQGTIIYNHVSNHMQFDLNGTGEKLRITSGGAVGINEDSPTGKLTITQDPQGFPSDSAQPNATILIKHGTSGTNRRWVGIGASLTGAWLQSSSPGGTGLQAPFWINKGGGDVSIGSGGTKLFIKHATQPSIGIGNNTPVGNLDIRDTKANLIVAKTGLTVKGNSDLSTTYDMIQLGAGGALASYSTATATADTELIHNAYRHSGNNWKYRYQDTACKLLMNTPGGAFIFQSAASGNADADITFSEKLRLDSSGRLLVGTDVAPSSTNTLLRVHTPISSSSVNSIEISHNTNGADKAGAALGLAIGNGGASTNAADLYFSTATNGSLVQRLRITSDGKVGINRSAPRSTLDVFETVTGNQTAIRIGNENTPPSANDRRIEFVDGTGTTEGTNKFTYGYIQGIRAGGSNSGELVLGTKASNAAAPVERLRIDDDGQMGLGMTPTRMFEVKDSTNANRIMNIRGTGTSGAFLAFLDANTTDDSYVRVGTKGGNAMSLRGDEHHFEKGSDGSHRMTIDSSGNINQNNTSPLSAYSSYRHINQNNNLILQSSTSQSGGFTGMSNNAYVNASGNWTRIRNDRASDIGMDDGNLWFRQVAAGTGNISWSTPFHIANDGKIYVNSAGSYGSSPGVLNIGRRAADPGGVTVNIARGEAIGGGTGPVLSLIHGPDGGTQRVHNIYSYVGDLRVYADVNEDLELRGANVKLIDGNNDSRVEMQSDGDFKVANPGWSTTSSPSSNCFQGMSQLGHQHWGHRQYYSKSFNLTQNGTVDLISNNTAHDDIIFWLNVKGYHANRTFATVHGTIGGYGITYHSQHGASGSGFSLSAANLAYGRNMLRFTSTSSYGAQWWVWGWISGTAGTGTHTGMTAKQLH